MGRTAATDPTATMTDASTSAARDAAAKINLSLRVTGRRADGYHLLDSLVAFCTVADRVEAAPAASLSLTVSGPFAPAVPTDDDNLVLRAARALAARYGVGAGAALHLRKHLPAAAGVGGGSADAAAALHALCALWGLTPDPAELRALALSLGADVPVCLEGRTCRMTGIGEILSPLPPLPEAGILLVNPGVACETPAVFRARQGDFSAPGAPFHPGRDAAALAAALAEEPNDLTQAAIAVCPPIRDVLDRLGTLEGVRLIRMSGSGATCFALFDDGPAAEAALRHLDAPAAWWAATGRLLA